MARDLRLRWAVSMHIEFPTGDFAGYLFDLDGTLIDTMPVHLSLIHIFGL